MDGAFASAGAGVDLHRNLSKEMRYDLLKYQGGEPFQGKVQAMLFEMLDEHRRDYAMHIQRERATRDSQISSLSTTLVRWSHMHLCEAYIAIYGVCATIPPESW